jgi:hypothetical protein
VTRCPYAVRQRLDGKFLLVDPYDLPVDLPPFETRTAALAHLEEQRAAFRRTAAAAIDAVDPPAPEFAL